MPIKALKFKSDKSKPKPTSHQTNRLPIFLVAGMAACLGVTAFASYKMGDAALEGVSQPESISLGQNGNQSTEQSSGGEKKASAAKFTPMNINQVSKDTREYIKKQKTSSKDTTSGKDESQSKAETDAEKKP